MGVYHIVYKTVNLLNNKFYIGVHKSAKLMDEYLGSGRCIVRSIKKYGRENFIRDNLFIFLDSASAYGKEAELVSLHLKDPLCMNLKQGGMGGFDFINENGKSGYSKGGYNSIKKLNLRFETDKEYRKKISIIRSSLLKEMWNTGKLRYIGNNWLGRHHSEESKEKMSKTMKDRYNGSNNPSYGTCWVTNGQENKKIKLTDLQTWVNQGWERGRKNHAG